MHKEIMISLLCCYSSMYAMVITQKQKAAAVVHSYLSQNEQACKHQPYLTRLQNLILLQELQKSPWLQFDDDKVQVDHGYKRFYVSTKSSQVLTVHNLAHEDVSGR